MGEDEEYLDVEGSGRGELGKDGCHAARGSDIVREIAHRSEKSS